MWGDGCFSPGSYSHYAVHPTGIDGLRGYRGGYQGARGGTQASRAGGRSGAHPSDGRGQLYAVPALPKAEASNVVVTGVILVCPRSALALFNPGSTYSIYLLIMHHNWTCSVIYYLCHYMYLLS